MSSCLGIPQLGIMTCKSNKLFPVSNWFDSLFSYCNNNKPGSGFGDHLDTYTLVRRHIYTCRKLRLTWALTSRPQWSWCSKARSTRLISSRPVEISPASVDVSVSSPARVVTAVEPKPSQEWLSQRISCSSFCLLMERSIQMPLLGLLKPREVCGHRQKGLFYHSQ